MDTRNPLDDRDLIGEIWTAYQRSEAVTALVKCEDINDAVSAMRWASALAGLRYGTRLRGFARSEVRVFEPPYPSTFSSFGSDLGHRLLMFIPRQEH